MSARTRRARTIHAFRCAALEAALTAGSRAS
jgi:hypothetical protein